MTALDVRNVEIKVGNTVVRGYCINQGGSVGLVVSTVTKVDGKRVYLNGSKIPMKFPERLAVVA